MKLSIKSIIFDKFDKLMVECHYRLFYYTGMYPNNQMIWGFFPHMFGHSNPFSVLVG